MLLGTVFLERNAAAAECGVELVCCVISHTNSVTMVVLQAVLALNKRRIISKPTRPAHVTSPDPQAYPSA